MSEAGKPAARVSPEGSLCIERASSLKTQILGHFERGEPVDFDFSAIVDIDLPCLQVLYAAKREGRARGLGFRLSGRLSSRVVRRLRTCGFVTAVPDTGIDLENTLVGWATEGS